MSQRISSHVKHWHKLLSYKIYPFTAPHFSQDFTFLHRDISLQVYLCTKAIRKKKKRSIKNQLNIYSVKKCFSSSEHFLKQIWLNTMYYDLWNKMKSLWDNTRFWQDTAVTFQFSLQPLAKCHTTALF